MWFFLATFQINDLKPDTMYMFIVRAENSHGLSVPSEISEGVRTLGLNTVVPQHLLDEARSRLGTKVLALKELIPAASTSVRVVWEVSYYCCNIFLTHDSIVA